MRPRAAWLIVTLVTMAGFIVLGAWQWQRGAHRAALQAQFAAGDHALAPGGSDLERLPRFARVEVRGEYDTAHQFLLDNLSHSGRPGYQVLTPLRLAGGHVLLVNRGWLAFTGYRDRLPDIALRVTGPSTVRGRIDSLPSAGLASGRVPPSPSPQAPWPRITTFPAPAELSAALAPVLPGTTVHSRMLLLDADQPGGYTREWQPPGLAPARHIAYAVQWWAFAVLALVLLVVLNRRRPA